MDLNGGANYESRDFVQSVYGNSCHGHAVGMAHASSETFRSGEQSES
jgi:hypothetical protein